ncbi:MAG: hypothetical protein Q9227_008877 [Pyrenula ochraceoflavens]
MDGSAGGAQAQPGHQQQNKTSLIRPEQVRQLPHLKDDEKLKYQRFIEAQYAALRTHPQGSPENQKTYNTLLQVSSRLMSDMKRYREEQAQARARAAQPHSANVQAPQPGQFYPSVEEKLNTFKFTFPPGFDPASEKGQTWLREARTRMGQALQKNELGRHKLIELTKEHNDRQSSGNPHTPQESEQFNAKVAQCKKYINDGKLFLTQFQQQQQEFKQKAEELASNPPQAPSTMNGGMRGAPPGQKPLSNQAPTTTQGPTPHTISTAVSAARNANTTQQTATSPNNAAGQPQTGSALADTPQQGQTPFTSVKQEPDTNAAGQITNQSQPGVPRSASQSGPSAPPNFGNMSNIQPNTHQTPSSATHAHPPGYLVGTVKKDGFQIPKTMNHVPPPRPVALPPSRPTLTGSSGHVVGGPLGQPALPKMPGYVLESSEDGRLLSKKKLDELVREITGIDAEQLTPEVEEVLLSVADEFVDDLLTASCRVAKLRGAQQLEARDIQLILERNYNIRVPGYTSDDVRTYHHRKAPAGSWNQKMGAVTAAKVTGGGNISAGTNENGPGGKDN